MLEGSFYHIVQKDGLCVTIVLNVQHPIYKAHFPDKPITPGACLVQIAEELLQQQIVRITNLKFLQIVPPTAELVYTFTPRNEQEYQVTITDTQHTYARFIATYMRSHTHV